MRTMCFAQGHDIVTTVRLEPKISLIVPGEVVNRADPFVVF